MSSDDDSSDDGGAVLATATAAEQAQSASEVGQKADATGSGGEEEEKQREVSFDDDSDSDLGDDELPRMQWSAAHIGGADTAKAQTAGRLCACAALTLAVALLLLALATAVLFTAVKPSEPPHGGIDASPSLLSSLLPAGLSVAVTKAWGAEDADAAARVSAAEREALSLLTGRFGVSRLSPSLLSSLRTALHQLALTVLVLRPAVQKALWDGHCRSHTPCPFPDAAQRRATIAPLSDDVLRRALTARPPLLSSWMESWYGNVSAESLFHIERGRDAGTGAGEADYADALTPAIPLTLAPGELASDQLLAARFQRELFAAQHPANCSAVRWLIQDFYHAGGGASAVGTTRAQCRWGWPCAPVGR